MRLLTDREITLLEEQGCTAEDWTAISVDDEFSPAWVRRVHFYGDVRLGVYEKSISVSEGFPRHTGIFNATLRNVSIGDNSLVENIGNFINNYTIGDDCLITNVSTLDTTDGATFGEGTIIPVLNEAGDGNVMIYGGLTAQMAALMVKYGNDREFTARLRGLIREELAGQDTWGSIGNRVRIVNTQQIVNTRISDDCEIDGACRLSECTLQSTPGAPVYVGSGVICENSIVFAGTSILDSSKLECCFVGEACKIVDGFTAENSVFFANSYMANGEACAAFCGPFTSSHHKSTLLIGVQLSFYNAGSNTNFSNHLYKMGPVHFGTLERGVKTASGSHVLLPAQIGQFSVCLGKLTCHPDTRDFPFSYIMSDGRGNLLVPGRNLVTSGFYRDIRKWPKRDRRTVGGRRSIVNFDWLSPFSAARILEAKRTLEELRRSSGDRAQTYNFQDCTIKATSLRKGIEYYDMALRIFMGAIVKRHGLAKPVSDVGKGQWSDLSGLLLPLSEEQRIVENVKDGGITSAQEILEELKKAHRNYAEYSRAWGYRLLCEYYGVGELTEEVAEKIRDDYVAARRAWVAEIRKDAVREFGLGDVEQKALDNFLHDLDKETDFENLKYDM